MDNIWAGTAAMVGNDGKRTNEAAFWDRFAALYGERVREDIPLFDAFYRQEFQQAKAFCGFTPKARAAVEACKAAGHRVALATNPIFPAVARRPLHGTPPMRTSATASPTPIITGRFCGIWAAGRRTA